MMGAMRVHALAEELETVLRERGEAENLIVSLDAELRPLAAALHAALPVEAAEAATAPASAKLLARLESLLAEDNIEASQVLREALPELRALLGPVAATLERQIAGYDYAEALATLRAAREGSSGGGAS
jgi:hypothetical protein